MFPWEIYELFKTAEAATGDALWKKTHNVITLGSQINGVEGGGPNKLLKH